MIAQDTITPLSVLYPKPPSGDNPYEIIADLNRRLDEDPGNTQLLASRAIQYSRVNDYEYAFRDMKQAIALAPDDHALYYQLGLIYYKKKAYPECIRALCTAIEMAPGNQDYLLLRSMAFLMNNQYIEAVEDAEMISEVNPYNTDAYLLAGKLYERLGLYYYSFKSYFLFLKYEQTDKANIQLVEKHLKRMKKKDKYFRDLMKKAKKEAYGKSKE
jgi:tetratricopeptide (TPR) repeat protein